MYDFITHAASNSFGYSVYIMGCDGRAFGRVTMYTNPSRCWISDISVDADFRRQGIGSELLLFCESISLKLSCCDVLLAVERGSWMYDWYCRRGYFECEDAEGEFVKLQKTLKP